MARRDSAIKASNLLPGENRDKLRKAPLTFNLLLGGLCHSVAEDNAAQRQRDRLVRPPPPSRFFPKTKQKQSKPRSKRSNASSLKPAQAPKESWGPPPLLRSRY